jgi:hypothetical protein
MLFAPPRRVCHATGDSGVTPWQKWSRLPAFCPSRGELFLSMEFSRLESEGGSVLTCRQFLVLQIDDLLEAKYNHIGSRTFESWRGEKFL